MSRNETQRLTQASVTTLFLFLIRVSDSSTYSEHFPINSRKRKKKRKSKMNYYLFGCHLVFVREVRVYTDAWVGRRQKTWYSGCRGNSGAHQTKLGGFSLGNNVETISSTSFTLGVAWTWMGKTCCQLCVAMFSDNRLDPTQNMFLLIWSFLWPVFLIDGRQLSRVRKLLFPRKRSDYSLLMDAHLSPIGCWNIL